MILVLANPSDETAERLATRWAEHDARVVTPGDLCRPGWHYRPGDGRSCRLVTDGQVVEADRIKGVLIRLPFIYPHELSSIEPCERQYVADEVTAFLMALLAELPCPVVNRPTPTGLMGPFWHPEKWALAAAQLGIPVAPVVRHVEPEQAASASAEPGAQAEPRDPGATLATVVGERCFGGAVGKARVADERLETEAHRSAVRLARAAGVNLLSVSFVYTGSAYAFVSANLCPELPDDVCSALLDHFLGAEPNGGSPCRGKADFR